MKVMQRSMQWVRARTCLLSEKSLRGYKPVFIARIPEVLQGFKPIVYSKVSLNIPVEEVLSKLSPETEVVGGVIEAVRVKLCEALEIAREKRDKALFIKLREIREHSVNFGEHILMIDIESKTLANVTLAYSLYRNEFLKYGGS